MITKYNTYLNEALENEEHTKLLYYLQEKFTFYREHIDYLKPIWYKVKHNDYVDFEIDIIWFYSRYDYKIIYTLTKKGFNLLIHDFVINEKTYKQFSSFKDLVESICQNLSLYLDYTSYPILKKIMQNKLIVLDYDKFLKEFDEQLAESNSKELYDIIDNFDTILWYKDKEEVKEIKNKLKLKYDYIYNARNFDLI